MFLDYRRYLIVGLCGSVVDMEEWSFVVMRCEIVVTEH